MPTLVLEQELRKQLAGLLLRCEQFESDGALRAVFTVAPIHIWRDALPQADSPTDRVDRAIAYLCDLELDGQSALVLFLQVLRQQVAADGRQREFDQICAALAGPVAVSGADAPPDADRYACFISFPHMRHELARKFVEDVYEALESELELQVADAIFYDRRRLHNDYQYPADLAPVLCKSVCMVVVIVPSYFDKRRVDWAREYRAMRLLEEQRLQHLDLNGGDQPTFIIPIVLRDNGLPAEVRETQYFDFADYYSRTEKLSRHPKYAPEIRKIAEYIGDICRLMEEIPDSLEGCQEFDLPPEEDVRAWLEEAIDTRLRFSLR